MKRATKFTILGTKLMTTKKIAKLRHTGTKEISNQKVIPNEMKSRQTKADGLRRDPDAFYSGQSQDGIAALRLQ